LLVKEGDDLLAFYVP